MSYVVSIVRDTPIDPEEVRTLATALPAFEIEDADGVFILHWSDSENDKRESCVLSDGSLDTKTPSDGALEAAQELAARLGARVVGEEGEDLSTVHVTGSPPAAAGCGPFAGSVLLIAVLLAIYWFLN